MPKIQIKIRRIPEGFPTRYGKWRASLRFNESGIDEYGKTAQEAFSKLESNVNYERLAYGYPQAIEDALVFGDLSNLHDEEVQRVFAAAHNKEQNQWAA